MNIVAWCPIRVKCADTFRIAFMENPKVLIEQKEGQDRLGPLLYLSSDTENLSFWRIEDFAGKKLKNHYIRLFKTPKTKQ